MSYYRQQLEDWLETIDVNADLVLDIGGVQGPVTKRVKSWQVNEYHILDLPDNDLENVNYLNGSDTRFANSADIIFCLEVFEYLINPIQALNNIANCLKPGGKAFVTFAFIYPHHNELEADSLRYTESGIKRLAEKCDLQITDIWYRRDATGLLEKFYGADGMRAAKQYAHHNVTGFIVELTK